MSIHLDPRLAETFPELFVCGFIARLDRTPDPARAAAHLAFGVRQARATLEALDAVTDDPGLAEWRRAYALAGLKPSRHRSSIEALARRAVKGELAPITPLVDLYNGCSLADLAPLGAVDLDRLAGDRIDFRLADPVADHFTPLGGDPDAFPLSGTLPVYAAGSEVLCWGFNCRDSRTTALSDDTRTVLFLSEGVTALHRDRAVTALTRLADLLAAEGARVEPKQFVSFETASEPARAAAG